MTRTPFRDILEHPDARSARRTTKGDYPMKAIRVSEYGGPSVLKIQEVPTPEPGPNQVLVRNHGVVALEERHRD
jgi:hypothetical protein